MKQAGSLLRDFLFALEIVWRVHRGLAVLMGALVVIQGVIPVGAMLILRAIVDAVSARKSAAELSLLVALAGGLALLAVVCRAVAELTQEVQTQLVTDDIARRIHAHSCVVDIAYYEDSRYFDTLHQAQYEASFRPAAIVSSSVQLVQQTITLAGLSYLIARYNWLMAAVLLLVALPAMVYRMRYAHHWRQTLEQLAEKDRQTHYYGALMTGSGFAREVRLFGLGGYLQGLYQSGRERIRAVRIKALRGKTVIDLLLEAFATAVLFVCLYLVARSALEGRLSPGDLVLYYQAFVGGFASLQLTLRSVSSLYEHTLFLEHLQRFLALKPSVVVSEDEEPAPARLEQGIACSGVTFSYSPNGVPVLKGMDMEVKAGQVVAIVGPNGCGKSTLVKLLCRFYDPDSGSITVDGADLCRLDPVKWQAKVAVLFQDFIRYYFTVEDNIRVGSIEGDVTDTQIEEAAKASGVHQTIAAMPEGYKTMLGNEFFGGHEISGGEWQRIAVARAFLRDAQLLILDEPSSALDALAEAELFARFKELIHGKTAVIISHRFSTVKMADYIYVMDKGAVVEHGTHSQLVNLGGVYARMYSSQAASYRD